MRLPSYGAALCPEGGGNLEGYIHRSLRPSRAPRRQHRPQGSMYLGRDGAEPSTRARWTVKTQHGASVGPTPLARSTRSKFSTRLSSSIRRGRPTEVEPGQSRGLHQCPNMPVVEIWLPARTTTAVAWRRARTWGHRTNEDESRLCRALGFGKGRTAASTATFLKCGAHALFGSLPVRAQWPGSEAAGPTACCQRVSSATVTARYPEIRWVTASAWSTGRL